MTWNTNLKPRSGRANAYEPGSLHA